jgi:hypothetical protein
LINSDILPSTPRSSECSLPFRPSYRSLARISRVSEIKQILANNDISICSFL